MLSMVLICWYLCGLSFVLGFFPLEWESRPTLESLGIDSAKPKAKKSPFGLLRMVANINKPIRKGNLRVRIAKDLTVAHVDMTPEEFLFIKELGVFLALFILFPSISPEYVTMWLCMGFVIGYMMPEFWIKGKIKKVKKEKRISVTNAIYSRADCPNFDLKSLYIFKKTPLFGRPRFPMLLKRGINLKYCHNTVQT